MKADPKEMFPRLCIAKSISCPHREFRFHPDRRFRFDWAWPDRKVALEVEGGVWTGGRHTSGSGFLKDMEKYNLAALNGWYVLRCTPPTLNSPSTFAMLKEILCP